MLTILGRGTGKSGRLCDGISRRGFLTIGGMALGGLALPEVLRAEAKACTSARHRAIINIYMPGGPSHIDLWDLKPDAPAEIRGEFQPIATNVPGIEICEEAFIGAGAVVTKDVPAGTVMVGVPARVLRDVPEDELRRNGG